MSHHARRSSLLTLLAVLIVVGVLGLYRTESAVSQPPRLPFNNSVEQRAEMIKELRQIRQLLQEQNRLLRTWTSQNRGAATSGNQRTGSKRRGR